jgi:hypothetical protein
MSNLSPKINVYQLYYRTPQARILDPAFIPQDGTENPAPELYEIYWLFHLYASGKALVGDYCGLMSWKFFPKTRVSGKNFLSFIRANTGYDVYFINPFPFIAYLFYNAWEQGNHCHPGIIPLAQGLVDKAGYPLSITNMGRNNHETLLFCNFWVGNTTFWQRYIAFLDPLFRAALSGDNGNGQNRFFEVTRHRKRPTPFFPFIFERLFSTFLLHNPDIRALPYEYSHDRIVHSPRHRATRQAVERIRPVVDRLDSDTYLRNSAGYRSFFKAVSNCVRKGEDGLNRLSLLGKWGERVCESGSWLAEVPVGME